MWHHVFKADLSPRPKTRFLRWLPAASCAVPQHATWHVPCLGEDFQPPSCHCLPRGPAPPAAGRSPLHISLQTGDHFCKPRMIARTPLCKATSVWCCMDNKANDSPQLTAGCIASKALLSSVMSCAMCQAQSCKWNMSDTVRAMDVRTFNVKQHLSALAARGQSQHFHPNCIADGTKR